MKQGQLDFYLGKARDRIQGSAFLLDENGGKERLTLEFQVVAAQRLAWIVHWKGGRHGDEDAGGEIGTRMNQRA